MVFCKGAHELIRACTVSTKSCSSVFRVVELPCKMQGHNHAVSMAHCKEAEAMMGLILQRAIMSTHKEKGHSMFPRQAED